MARLSCQGVRRVFRIPLSVAYCGILCSCGGDVAQVAGSGDGGGPNGEEVGTQFAEPPSPDVLLGRWTAPAEHGSTYSRQTVFQYAPPDRLTRTSSTTQHSLGETATSVTEGTFSIDAYWTVQERYEESSAFETFALSSPAIDAAIGYGCAAQEEIGAVWLSTAFRAFGDGLSYQREDRFTNRWNGVWSTSGYRTVIRFGRVLGGGQTSGCQMNVEIEVTHGDPMAPTVASERVSLDCTVGPSDEYDGLRVITLVGIDSWRGHVQDTELGDGWGEEVESLFGRALSETLHFDAARPDVLVVHPSIRRCKTSPTEPTEP